MPDTTPSRDLASDNLMSLQSHILAEEQQHPGASGDFSWILSAIALATKTIGNKVRRARIDDVLGDFGDQRNIHDEQQKKMDVVANEIIKACLGNRANIGVLVSEEDEEPMVLRTHAEGGRYAVLFDPLDGSSNLDFSVGVGTIFSIHRLEAGHAARGVEAVLHPGTRQVAAGYVLYGSSTVFVLTTGNGVDMFVLDQSIGSYVLVESKSPDTRVPEGLLGQRGVYASVSRRRIVNTSHGLMTSSIRAGTSVRWSQMSTGHCFEAVCFSIHRPKGHPDGKLRLLYEANPMSMIIEDAGGLATTGKQRILDIKPKSLHQRTPVVLGSPEEVANVERFTQP